MLDGDKRITKTQVSRRKSMRKDIYKSPEFCVIQLAEDDAVWTSNGKDGDMYDNDIFDQ